MTKNCKILSVQLSAEELAAIDTLVQAPPYFGNRSMFARVTLLSSLEKPVEVAPQIQPLIDYYTRLADQKELDHQAQLNQLEADYQAKIDRLKARVTDYDQTLEACEERLEQQRQLIDRLEAEDVTFKIEHGVKGFDREQRIKELERKLEMACQNEQRWKTDYEQVKAQLKKSQENDKFFDAANNMISAFKQLATAPPKIS